MKLLPSVFSSLYGFSFSEIYDKFVISKPGGKATDVFAEIVLDNIQIFRGCGNYCVICIGDNLRISERLVDVIKMN